jgi:hypothetical protein
MNDIRTTLRSLARQEQFLEVVDRDEATTRFQRHLRMRSLGAETVPLSPMRSAGFWRGPSSQMSTCPALTVQASMGLRCGRTTLQGRASVGQNG